MSVNFFPDDNLATTFGLAEY